MLEYFYMRNSIDSLSCNKIELFLPRLCLTNFKVITNKRKNAVLMLISYIKARNFPIK